MIYRPDIDGLRAVAVAAIIAFHLGMERFSGGFVGVDIFYIISGFLIGGIVVGELERGSFSIREFYRRRLKRILPALVIVLLFTTAAAWLILFPVQFTDYAASLIATTFFVANMYFWNVTNYFFVSKPTPLLHFWSLGVEEQYYIFFPLLAVVIFRWRAALFPWTIALVATASFALSVALSFVAPVANFYLLPTRAWELLLGVLISKAHITRLESRPLREALSVGGFMILALSIHRTSQSFFPGVNALPPCLATAAIILAGTHGPTAVGSLLSTRPFVFPGLLSYSLYLWHWPIIVFAHRYLPALHLDRGTKAVAVIATLILSILTWQFIEKPFRASKKPFTTVIAWSTGALASLVLVATVILANHGFASRFNDRTAALASMLAYDYAKAFRAHQCFLEQGDTINTFDREACLSESRTKPNVLLIGDSHAAHLWYGLQAVFKNTNVMQATSAICRPFPFKQEKLLNLENVDDYLASCNQLMDLIYNDYLAHHRPDLIVLAGSWNSDDEYSLTRTLDWLSERRFPVLLVGPAPNWDLPLPTLVALAEMRNDPGTVERNLNNSQQPLDRRLATMATERGVKYASLFEELCSSGKCQPLGGNGLPFMFDREHLTAEGSKLVAAQLADPSLRR